MVVGGAGRSPPDVYAPAGVPCDSPMLDRGPFSRARISRRVPYGGGAGSRPGAAYRCVMAEARARDGVTRGAGAAAGGRSKMSPPSQSAVIASVGRGRAKK